MKWSDKVKDGSDDTLLIAKTELPVKKCELYTGDLKFWKNNPRIYSIVHGSDQPLSQQEIQQELLGRPHVRELMLDITFHGGLIHNILVIDQSFEVIEGNSRLAAYRGLAGKNQSKFGRIKCSILPAGTDEKLIYAYLNQEHIKGKTEWIPYEQAGIFYRLSKKGEDVKNFAAEINVSTKLANKFIKTYEFMVRNGEDRPSRWSYYEEYLKNRKIAEKRDSDKRLDAVVIDQIRKKKFTAQELRDYLPIICSNEKAYEKFASAKTDLVTTYENLEGEGKVDELAVRFKEMHEFIMTIKKEDIESLQQKAAKDVKFRIDKIITKLSTLKKQAF